jgi:hypothetical protein
MKTETIDAALQQRCKAQGLVLTPTIPHRTLTVLYEVANHLGYR